MQLMRARLVGLLYQAMVERGADADAVADRVGIPATARRPVQRIEDMPPVPTDRIRAFAEEAARATGDPFFGLGLGARLERGSYGVLEFALRYAPTVKDAAQRLLRYERLNNDVMVWTIDPSPSALVIGQRVPGSSDGMGRQINEFWLSTAIQYIRELTAAPYAASRVEFAHTEPPPLMDPLAERFGTEELAFGTGENRLLLPLDLWERAVVSADPALLAILDDHAQALLPRQDPSTGVRLKVREHLRRHLSGAEPALEKTARALGLSARSLQRKLQEEGLSYRDVVDEVRREEACRLLETTDVAIDEITFLLGYADRRSFLRAFGRWTDTTPTRYRSRARAE